MTFKRPSDHRSIKFEEIATETKLPLKEVEILIMKALAQGLVKGAIDQVSGVVNMTWVCVLISFLYEIESEIDQSKILVRFKGPTKSFE